MRWLEISADYRCNNRCLGCEAAGDGGPSMTSAQVVAELARGRRAGATALWLGGGEPTLRRDLVPVVREARRLGYTQVRLQTNGLMLAYPEVPRRLAGAGLTEVSVSIKGAQAATHDRLTRTPGGFELLLRGIAEARAAGLPVEGDILVYASNTAELADAVRAFHARGVARFRVWLMAPPEGDAEAIADEPRLAAVVAELARAQALGLSDDPAFLVSLHTPPCTLRGPLQAMAFHAPDLALEVVTPGSAPFALEASPIEGGAYLPGCAGCRLRPRCGGARAGYLARHGGAELWPLP
jgi:cyclic pyranopterin phosphate synthase